jgi:uncharacterized BrkB/YihY/UPF0761 family membrane protein
MRLRVLVAGRVVRQLLRNPRFLVLSVAAPLVIVYLLKIFFDTLPERANDVIQDVIESGWSLEDVRGSLAVLVAYSVVLLLLASLTLREVE